MPQINLGKVRMTDADLLAKPEAAESQIGDKAFIAQGNAVKQLPFSKITCGAASNIKIIDIGSGSFDPSGIDFTQYSPGDIILVVGDMR